jgi:arginine utilization protein RocB
MVLQRTIKKAPSRIRRIRSAYSVTLCAEDIITLAMLNHEWNAEEAKKKFMQHATRAANESLAD